MRKLVVSAALAALLAGCAGSGPAQLLETAQLEEKQRNVPHARKLYQQIVDQHPGTPEAAQAQARLAALGAESPGG